MIMSLRLYVQNPRYYLKWASISIPRYLGINPVSLPGYNHGKLICTTEEGEILLADWRARIGVGGKEDDAAGGGTAAGNEDGGDIAPEFVKWVSRDHTRPCVALDKSPFFPGVLLSVGDWSFQIWKVMVENVNICTWCILTSLGASLYLD